jgi:thiol:disulfide interchange protein DsbD
VSPEVAQAADGKEAGAAEPWSTERLGTLRSEGRPVLVNMTAAWCITCLANERLALSSAAFAERLDQLDIAYLKGDWTQRDAAITRYLAEFGRNGVPLYVLYPRGGGEPTVLPQLLTPDLVLAALDSAAAPAPVPLATAVPSP